MNQWYSRGILFVLASTRPICSHSGSQRGLVACPQVHFSHCPWSLQHHTEEDVPSSSSRISVDAQLLLPAEFSKLGASVGISWLATSIERVDSSESGMVTYIPTSCGVLSLSPIKLKDLLYPQSSWIGVCLEAKTRHSLSMATNKGFCSGLSMRNIV